VLLYFVIGGVIVATVTIGSHAKAAGCLYRFFPSISVITLCTIHSADGTEAAVSYAKSMLVLCHLGYSMLWCDLPSTRIGLAGSLIASIAAYSLTAFLIMRLT